MPTSNRVDIIASLSEKGINHFLSRIFEIDQGLPDAEKKFTRTFERSFDTFDDQRKFKITLSLLKPVEVKLPPFTAGIFSGKKVSKKDLGNAFDYPTNGPNLTASYIEEQLVDKKSLVEIVASEVTVELEWPNLKPGQPPHKFKIPAFEVVGTAELELNQEGNDFFISIIPQSIKINISSAVLSSIIASRIKEIGAKELTTPECEQKFVDLFIIAANIVAYEQTPKLITSIKLPAPTIKDRPIQPSTFNISDNFLTMGFSIDKVNLQKFNENILSSKEMALDFALNTDIEKAGSLEKIVYQKVKGNKDGNTLLAVVIHGLENQLKQFQEVNTLIKKDKDYVASIENEEEYKYLNDVAFSATDTTDKSYAIGINEYFFDTIVDSSIPSPKHRCEKERRLGPVKGYVCHWKSFRDPDISVNRNASVSGSVYLNLGGSIHACVKKFWDCSWRWQCGKLSLGIAGRPKLDIALRKANGIRLVSKVNLGGLRVVSNLPFPFNKIIEFFGSLVFKVIEAFINSLAALLTFFVIRPDFEIESLHAKLLLRNFNSFYFKRSDGDEDITKNKFIAFETELQIIKI